MTIRDENIETVHISEIGTIVIDTTMVSITSALLNELVDNKVKVIFCDEKHLPKSELIPYYGSHNTSKRIVEQINWDDSIKKDIWTFIVKQKINNQANMLLKQGLAESELLLSYVKDTKPGDITNREGFAAKVYFNALFGQEFNRKEKDSLNIKLNYGYTLLLSCFSKEIVKNGYITQLGLGHKNEYNFYNFASDLTEPFRIIIDEIVYEEFDTFFDKDMKLKLLNVFNKQIEIENKNYYLTNAIELFCKSIFLALNNKDLSLIKTYEFK